jgi:hypothetical protein
MTLAKTIDLAWDVMVQLIYEGRQGRTATRRPRLSRRARPASIPSSERLPTDL